MSPLTMKKIGPKWDVHVCMLGTSFQRRGKGVFIILTLAVTRGLGLNGLVGRITPFSHLLQQARGTENLFWPIIPRDQGKVFIFNTDLIYNSSHATCEYVLMGFRHSIFSIIWSFPWAKIKNSPKKHLCHCLPNSSQDLLIKIVTKQIRGVTFGWNWPSVSEEENKYKTLTDWRRKIGGQKSWDLWFQLGWAEERSFSFQIPAWIYKSL